MISTYNSDLHIYMLLFNEIMMTEHPLVLDTTEQIVPTGQTNGCSIPLTITQAQQTFSGTIWDPKLHY